MSGTLRLVDSKYSFPKGSFPGRLDSKLIQSWAPRFTTLHLEGCEVSTPGLAGFVEAAAALQDVELAYLSEDEASMADFIFQGSTSIRYMTVLGGSRLPCIWPLGIQWLGLQLEDMLSDHMRDRQAAEQGLLHGLLCSLLRLPSLSTLYLNIDSMGTLRSCIKLPQRLQRLKVTMWLDDGHPGVLDLGWLKLQPCGVLELEVHITSPRPELQHGLIDELQRQSIILSSVEIITQVTIAAATLAKWKGVCTDYLELEEQSDAGHKRTVLIENGFD